MTPANPADRRRSPLTRHDHKDNADPLTSPQAFMTSSGDVENERVWYCEQEVVEHENPKPLVDDRLR